MRKIKSTIYSNYNMQNKWKGIIHYKSIFLLACILFIIFSVSNLLDFSVKVTFILFLISIPIGSVLLFCNTNKESSIDIIANILRFYFTAKVFCNDYKAIKNRKLKCNKIYIKKVVKNDFK